jgi:hypothetical protein
MTRREFRIIAGRSTGSPERQATSRRQATRREFTTIHCGTGAERGPRLQAVTIKCIDKTDGTTIWEYGPGSLWRHHYGADAISGVVPDLSATLNKYAIAAGLYPTYAACGNRNAATLTANVCEPLEVVKLDSLDGTTIESATLTGLFCDTITGTSVGLVSGLTMTNAAALSGGDYVIVGERIPFIEFLSFTSNTATKSYILHAHGLRDGNVYLKTRTSNETITIPYDSTAAEVDTLFEATADCTAATVTGGPWPLLPITVEATWSASSGDISGIATTGTYTAEGAGVVATFGITYVVPPIEKWTVTVTSVVVGAEFAFQFDGSGTLSPGIIYTYTSATDNASTFMTDLAADIATFITNNSAEDDWGSAVSSLSASVLELQYGFFARHMTLVITNGGGATDTRRAGMCAAAYDTGTGEMTSAVGYEFGYSEDRTPLKMFAETAGLPGTTGLSILGISAIGSGPSNSVIITPATRGSGDGVKANAVEKWSIASGVWTFGWQVYCNAVMSMPQIIQCEAGYVICPIDAKIFDSVNERTAARLQVTDGARTELMTTFGSNTAPNNGVVTAMLDGDASNYLSWGYDIVYQDFYVSNNRFDVNAHGADTWYDGTEFRLGAVPFAADSTAIYTTFGGSPVSGNFNYDFVGTSTDSTPTARFFASPLTRSAEPQQFRFKLDRMPGTNYTAWLDWYATEAEIETALNNLLGSGNCSILDFGGETDPVQNDPKALIECNPRVRFLTDAGYSPGSGFIPWTWFTYRNDGQIRGGVEIEVQTVTAATVRGLAAFNATTAAPIWSRAFGTALVGGSSVPYPLYSWLQGDYVYAYGQLLENEL